MRRFRTTAEQRDSPADKKRARSLVPFLCTGASRAEVTNLMNNLTIFDIYDNEVHNSFRLGLRSLN